VLSRIRLPLVVSLFLAALLGGPTASPVGEALPVPATVTTVAAPVVSVPLAEETRAAVAARAAAPVAPPASPAAAPQPVIGFSPALTHQVRAAVAAPRAPPVTA
jgi:hypothetical protein